MARDAKNNKKGFYSYDNQKRKVQASVPPLKNKNGDLVLTDKEKAEVLDKFFLPQSPMASLLIPPELMDCKMGTRGKSLPTLRENQVRDHLRNLKKRKMADAVARSLSNIFERSWQRGEVPGN